MAGRNADVDCERNPTGLLYYKIFVVELQSRGIGQAMLAPPHLLGIRVSECRFGPFGSIEKLFDERFR